MTFDWDADKAARNLRKHGVPFEEGETIFAGAAIFEDFDHSEKEPRYAAIGFSTKGRLLAVSFTRTGPEMYRLISVRRATRQERAQYGEAKQQEER